MNGYSTRDVATMLGITPSQVRSYARSGFLSASRDDRGDYTFSFHDLILLRTARELIAARLPARRIKASLEKLARQLPTGRPLTAVRIAAEGDTIVVRDGDTMWNPDSGQVLFDFGVSELASQALPLARKAAEKARIEEDRLSADDWYQLGCELEISAPDEARDAYRRALERDPSHADAHVNLGRLFHDKGLVPAAEAHYRRALDIDPSHTVARFNLAIAYEDLEREQDAVDCYLRVLEAAPEFADAHYNLATIFERRGDRAAAFEHLKAYRDLER